MESLRKILVVQPSWVGDAVMATPTLRALRELYPAAHISYLMRRYVKPIYTGMPWADQLITYRTGKTRAKAGKGQFFDLAARLRAAKFDAAILLPSSFKSALVCKMAGIDRIIGYERDGRGFLLDDKLLPVKDRGKFVPSPIVKYYLGIAHYLGSHHRDLRMQLFVTPSEQREAQDVFVRSGLDPDLARPAQLGKSPLIVINPGAQYGAAKCWPAEYFSKLADRFVEELGATVLISAAPKERPIVDSIKRGMTHDAVDLSRAGLTLGALKEIVRRCDLMVTNDTGPRHIAAAFDVPVVTVFGPTHPEWTEIYFEKERKVAVKVFCGPCQKKTCPLDHRCMTRVTPGMVFDNSMELLGRAARSAVVLLTLLALSLGIVAGCGESTQAGSGGPQQQTRDPVAVTRAPVTMRPVQRSVEVVGTLYGDEEATISAKVPGRITTIFKDVGDRSGPGEPLAQIEKTDYELARTQQRMAVQESLAKLGLSAFPDGEFDPAKVPLVERAKLQAHNAEAKFRRGEQLFKQTPPLLSEQDYADLRTAYDVARSDYDVQLLSARSILAEAATRKSEFDLAEQRLNDTTVRAPAATESEASAISAATSKAGAGRYAVAARLVSVGEYVREGTPMFRLVAADPIKFRAKVPERFAGQVRVGQKATVLVEAYSEVFQGSVARINPQVELTNRTFEVEVTVPNPDGRLQPGAFARGSILTHTDENVLFVPKASVVTFAGVSKVFTVADGKAVDHRVKVGVAMDDHVEIVDGLKRGAGDVVIGGAAKLAAGTPVTVKPATQPTAAPTTSRDP